MRREKVVRRERDDRQLWVPERTFAVKTLLYLEFRLSEILPTPPCTFAQAIVIRKSLIFGFLNPLEGFSV